MAALLLLVAAGCLRPAGKVCPTCGTNYGSTAVWCGTLHDGRAATLVAMGLPPRNDGAIPADEDAVTPMSR